MKEWQILKDMQENGNVWQHRQVGANGCLFIRSYRMRKGKLEVERGSLGWRSDFASLPIGQGGGWECVDRLIGVSKVIHRK